MRILLVRHGETEWNRIRRFQGRSDQPLNETGREQARCLARALKDEPLVAIHSSPLLRAMETAQIVRTFHPMIPILKEEDLVEMDLGDFDGLDALSWAEQHPEFLKAWKEDPSSVSMPGGESLQDVQKRAIGALERITESYSPGSSLLISSHNFVNMTILCYAAKIPLSRFRQVRQETAAVNILCKKGGSLWAEVINERSHLEKYRSSL